MWHKHVWVVLFETPFVARRAGLHEVIKDKFDSERVCVRCWVHQSREWIDQDWYTSELPYPPTTRLGPYR